MWSVRLCCLAISVALCSATQCPEVCRCNEQAVVCRQVAGDFLQQVANGSQLESVEMKILDSPDLKILNFSDYSVVDSLQGFKHLTISNSSVELILGDESAQLLDMVGLTLDNNLLIDDSSIPVIRAVFPRLELLSLRNNLVGLLQTDADVGLSEFQYLQTIDLAGNQLVAIPFLPQSARRVDLSKNFIRNRNQFGVGGGHLLHLDVSGNRLKSFDFAMLQSFTGLVTMNLSNNQIAELSWQKGTPSGDLQLLDISWNQLDSFDPQLLQYLPKLQELNITGNGLKAVINRFPHHANLKTFNLENSSAEFVLLKSFAPLSSLQRLSFANSHRLGQILGSLSDLPKLKFLSLRNCNATTFHPDFLRRLPASLEEADLSGNPLMCDCRGQWMLGLTKDSEKFFDGLKNVVCAGPESKNGILVGSVDKAEWSNATCLLGIAATKAVEVVWGHYGKEIRLNCNAYGNPQPKVMWRPSLYSNLNSSRFVFSWDPASETVQMPADNNFGVFILPGGSLLVPNPNRSHVSRFECIATNIHGNESTVLSFRLDHSEWRIMILYSCLCGVATAIGFCILNILYGCLRQLIVWRLSKIQENSRVRMMVEALEKYKQRQTEALQQSYGKRVEAIRDNYHSQADMLRRSYTAQLERFRDYKAAQIGSVSQHFDAMRENYNSQVGRIGYYGGRQMERLYDSYTAQINRIRAFTVQQRLRLMRQYQIKQRYVDKILHGLNLESCQDVPRESDIFKSPDRMMQFPAAEEILATDQLEPLALGLMGQDGDLLPLDGISVGKSAVEEYESGDAISISTYHSFGLEDAEEIPPLIPPEDVPWLRGGSSRAGSRKSQSAKSPQSPVVLELEADGDATVPTVNSSARLLEETNF